MEDGSEAVGVSGVNGNRFVSGGGGGGGERCDIERRLGTL